MLIILFGFVPMAGMQKIYPDYRPANLKHTDFLIKNRVSPSLVEKMQLGFLFSLPVRKIQNFSD